MIRHHAIICFIAKLTMTMLFTGTLIGCFGSTPSSEEDTKDITNAVFTSRSANCSDYANDYKSTISDGDGTIFNGSLTISVSGGKCHFESNSIPNHDVGEGGNFATKIGEVSQSFSISANPSDAASTTELNLNTDNAIFLNGAKLDLLAAACYGVGNEKTGCGADKSNDSYWRYDPMSPLNGFGTDVHNAHTQPNGAYHYHGDPKAMYDVDSTTTVSPLMGFAADGYPIFGPFFSDNGSIRRAKSCYKLKTGARQALSAQVGATPSGDYDGTYIQDYEFDETGTTCDLDECNGMTVDGVYGYYITDSYPWVMKCFKGTPDESFNK